MPERTNQIFGQYVAPEEVVEQAIIHNCKSISYTYTEPAIYLDYALEVAKIAHQRNITNIFVTNGYFTPESLKLITPYLDAANIDLKSFSDDFYKSLCSAKLQPVLDSIKLLKDSGVWIEVTTLLIPSKNDSNQEVQSIAEFITGVNKDIPWHISAFYPTYKLLEIPPTPVKTLLKAREIGINAGLHYVYTGNILDRNTETTYCYNCGEILIERFAYDIMNKLTANSSCPSCGTVIAGRGLVL
jgi:pyruvate formate lyase activating enzyme